VIQNAPCHRIGGGEPSNLKLKAAEAKLNPPGISVLVGGTAQQAAADFRRVFGPQSTLGKKAAVVGTAALDRIRAAGFDVIEDPSSNFPNHGRLIHPTEGAAGFAGENLERLTQAFSNQGGL
jgi:hypothetical protein